MSRMNLESIEFYGLKEIFVVGEIDGNEVQVTKRTG